MPELPTYVEAYMRDSILGRAKAKLYHEICGREHWMPEHSEIWRFIRGEFRKNPAAGNILLTLLTENHIRRRVFSDLIRPKDVSAVLKHMEVEPLDGRVIVQVSDCPEPLPNVLGICIHKEDLADGGYVYCLTLFDDARFPEAFSGYVEVRVCEAKPQPMFSVLSDSEFDHYDDTNYQKSWLAEFAIELIAYLDQNRPVSLVPLSEVRNVEVKEDSIHRPPEDEQLTAYIQAVLNNQLPCALATVPFKMIRPFSLDFCITYPRTTVEWEVKEIKQGHVSPMLVYWNGNGFVMSDDYSVYLAHRVLGSTSVPVVIIGKFPTHLAVGDIITGGSELIPPLQIMQRDDYASLPPEVKEWLIDARLRGKRISNQAATLTGIAMVLSEILGSPDTDEKRVHKFLAQYPISVDPHGSVITSELRLGAEYRVDLAIQYKLDDKRLLLIELEAQKNLYSQRKVGPTQLSHMRSSRLKIGCSGGASILIKFQRN